jgi:hypothetical protein
VDAFAQRFQAGGIDRGQPLAQRDCEGRHHLPVTIRAACQLAADPLQPGGQPPILERGTMARCVGSTRQNGDIVPGVERRPVAARTPRIFFTMDPQNELFGRQMANVPTPQVHTRTLFEDLM